MEYGKYTIYKKVCDHCGGEFTFNGDTVLHEDDATEAFEDIYVDSIRCPLCWERNILEVKGVDGKVKTAEFEQVS